MTENKNQEPELHEASFMEHLTELHRRLLVCVISIVVGFGVCYFFKEPFFEFLLQPLLLKGGEGQQLIFTGLPELFFTYVKMSFLGGLFIAFPLLFWEIWRFVAPGLYTQEKRVAGPLIFLTPFLFYTGGAFVYFLVMPIAVEFFLNFETENIQALPSVKEYLGFLTKMIFGFGIAFELPMLLLLLVKIKVLSVTALKKGRKYAVVAIFVAAAVLTPPDPASQLLLAVPMLLLYEMAIFGSLFISSKKQAEDSDKSSENVNS